MMGNNPPLVNVYVHRGGTRASAACESACIRLKEHLAQAKGSDDAVKIVGFEVLICIAGEFTNFGGSEGPERVLWNKKEKRVGLDLIIPIERAAATDAQAMHYYLSHQMAGCMELLLKKAVKIDPTFAVTQARSEISRVLEYFVCSKDELPADSQGREKYLRLIEKVRAIANT